MIPESTPRAGGTASDAGPAGSASPAPRARRRDAENNRAALLSAAAAVFHERGHEADVREIARRAGVGMGTLYRHFPSKEALTETLLVESHTRWVEETRLAVGTHASAWDALANFVSDFLLRQARNRALLEHLEPPEVRPAGCDLCGNVLRPLVAELVSAAHAEGALRPGVTADDVLRLTTALGFLVQSGTNDEALARSLDVVLTGLRLGAALP